MRIPERVYALEVRVHAPRSEGFVTEMFEKRASGAHGCYVVKASTTRTHAAQRARTHMARTRAES